MDTETMKENLFLKKFFPESYYVAQTGLEFVILLPQPPSAGIIGTHHYAQIDNLTFKKKETIPFRC
jgi:hypothetical protein